MKEEKKIPKYSRKHEQRRLETDLSLQRERLQKGKNVLEVKG
jgi:hypothetical protein